MHGTANASCHLLVSNYFSPIVHGWHDVWRPFLIFSKDSVQIPFLWDTMSIYFTKISSKITGMSREGLLIADFVGLISNRIDRLEAYPSNFVKNLKVLSSRAAFTWSQGNLIYFSRYMVIVKVEWKPTIPWPCMCWCDKNLPSKWSGASKSKKHH